MEDEDTVRSLVVKMLKSQGYKVMECADGEEAYMLCTNSSEPIHLILMDVVMPGMSGRQLAERLATVRPEAKLLYMSGYMDNGTLSLGVREGEIEFIQKPFTVDGLAKKVREILNKT